MHNKTSTSPRPSSRIQTGIILSAQPANGDDQLQLVRIGQEGGSFDAFSFTSSCLTEALDASLTVQTLQLVQCDDRPSTLPLLIGFQEDPFEDGLTHMPESVCPIEGVVLDIKRLIAGIQTYPLRAFLMNVFQRRDVFHHFWTMPASAKHHHAKPGGLAAHTLEVASDLSGHHGLTDLELDLGVAGALLHDIGKVWAYTDDMFLNAAGLGMGHELVGLARLEPQLTRLESAWEDGAIAMRTLLSGQSRMRDNGSLPSSLLPRIKACDQRSCERDRSRMRQSKYSRPVWTPRAWEDRISHGDFDFL